MSMRAVVLEAIVQGKPQFSNREMPVPVPRSGQVLVRMQAAPINPSDIAFIKGKYGIMPNFPCIPGFEGAGTVISSGGGLIGWSLVGKRVSLSSMTGGTWGQYAAVKALNCVKINDDIPFQQAACFFVNPLTVIQMGEYIANGKHQAVVHTAAASSLGKMLLRQCQDVGVPLINIVRREEQMNTLRELGAEYVLNSSQEGFSQQLRKVCSQLNATIAFEAVSGELTGEVLNALRTGGTVYVYGSLSMTSISNVNPGDLIFRKKSIQGLYMGDWIKQKNLLSLYSVIKRVSNMLNSTFRTDISREMPLEAPDEALEFYKRNMSQGKVIFRATLNQDSQFRSLKM